MALIIKGGAVFLHIPKTGGNWVREVLHEQKLIAGEIGHKHADIDHLHVINRKSIYQFFRNKAKYGYFRKKPFMFCFVRDPFKWYESWFKYMSRYDNTWRQWGNEKNSIFNWHPNSMLNGTQADTFDEFIKNVINKRPGFATEMFGWYTKPEVDFVGKQENLKHDLITILNMLNLKFDAEAILNHNKVGVSKQPKKKIVWNEELRQLVTRYEYTSLKRFGYL